MAGQGLNLGIADADALAKAVLQGRLSGTDVGSKTLLGRYEEERKVCGVLCVRGVGWQETVQCTCTYVVPFPSSGLLYNIVALRGCMV